MLVILRALCIKFSRLSTLSSNFNFELKLCTTCHHRINHINEGQAETTGWVHKAIPILGTMLNCCVIWL